MPSATYKTIIEAVEKYLRDDTQSLGPDKSKSNKQIVRALKRKIHAGELKVDVADGTMLAYLSEAANDDGDSGIVSGGPHAGYWYDRSSKTSTEPKAVDEQEIAEQHGKKITINERDLYPLMELWLQTKGYAAKDMSSLKRGGRWGNPDIIGVERVELMGVVEVDLASCEVKMTDNGWEQIIFEAISHKRFSNRSWFCYRVSEKEA